MKHHKTVIIVLLQKRFGVLLGFHIVYIHSKSSVYVATVPLEAVQPPDNRRCRGLPHRVLYASSGNTLPLFQTTFKVLRVEKASEITVRVRPPPWPSMYKIVTTYTKVR